jgi:hypothetical protein
MLRLAGEPRGRPQVGGGRGVLVEVDEACGSEQGGPSASHQQRAFLGERGPGVKKLADVAQVGADPAEQPGRRCRRVGSGQLVYGQREPLDGTVADVAGLGPAAEFEGGDLVVRGQAPHGCGPPPGRRRKRGQRSAGVEQVVQAPGHLG